ncbi:hypothetical protein OS493_028146 [Desmophyllum pertusum]|uniref:Uncharacterized protein n=1 Tax=Desmophyllum pertusum TaxID=174260 RepID=A0A9W9Z9P3_9CNID|nr:hypothetical protein OS493_028146 [Desmophyllum pertusum]
MEYLYLQSVKKMKTKFNFPISGNLSRNQNDSRLLHSNITNNELRTETIHASTEIFKTSSTNLPTTHTVGDMLDGFESGRANLKNSSTTVRTPLSTVESFTHIVVENYTTVSPSLTFNKHHGFDMKILGYIVIPIGCLMAIVVSYCLVRYVQKVKRKRRLERELLHQYSYPNSEADDIEEQNIGDIESIVNAQFVAFSDRSDKNLYEDSPEVNLAFDEGSKLVVEEPPPSPPEDFEASTSFTS